MDLFVIRHAAAVPRSPDLDDAARPLTPRGRRRFAKAVRGLGRLRVDFDRLYHSPWLRAVETADALHPLVRGESVVLPALTGSPQAAFFDELDGDVVGVVGHEPWLGELIALALVGRSEEGARFALKKGGVAWLTGEPRPGAMSLRALLPPRALRALARRA
jgi:phosphohistidine phosphatase